MWALLDYKYNNFFGLLQWKAVRHRRSWVGVDFRCPTYTRCVVCSGLSRLFPALHVLSWYREESVFCHATTLGCLGQLPVSSYTSPGHGCQGSRYSLLNFS